VDKSIYGKEQRILSELLRSAREKAGLRQVDVADRLGWPQSAVSKYESGERRLDLVELRQVCEAIGIALVDLVKRFDRAARQP
jgi:transcriptional regulator with XRE-family HTH domain